MGFWTEHIYGMARKHCTRVKRSVFVPRTFGDGYRNILLVGSGLYLFHKRLLKSTETLYSRDVVCFCSKNIYWSARKQFTSTKQSTSVPDVFTQRHRYTLLVKWSVSVPNTFAQGHRNVLPV